MTLQCKYPMQAFCRKWCIIPTSIVYEVSESCVDGYGVYVCPFIVVCVSVSPCLSVCVCGRLGLQMDTSELSDTFQ